MNGRMIAACFISYACTSQEDPSPSASGNSAVRRNGSDLTQSQLALDLEAIRDQIRPDRPLRSERIRTGLWNKADNSHIDSVLADFNRCSVIAENEDVVDMATWLANAGRLEDAQRVIDARWGGQPVSKSVQVALERLREELVRLAAVYEETCQVTDQWATFDIGECRFDE